MKKLIKPVLKRLGLYEFAQSYYYMLRHFSRERLGSQFRYRLFGAPDGHPAPPPRLVHKIIARSWAEEYWNMGLSEANHIVKILKEHGIEPDSFEHVLDLGCGCGRILRHFPKFTNARLYGSDYNSKLIRWCQKKLPFADFSINNLQPPLKFVDESFDFIYLISVLTHLSGPMQKRWMAELGRVTRPGAHIFFTTHGDRFLSFFDDEQRERFSAGDVVLIEDDEEGANYFGSFQSRRNVEENLMDGFELIAFVRGDGDLKQDFYIVKKV